MCHTGYLSITKAEWLHVADHHRDVSEAIMLGCQPGDGHSQTSGHAYIASIGISPMCYDQQVRVRVAGLLLLLLLLPLPPACVSSSAKASLTCDSTRSAADALLRHAVALLRHAIASAA